MGGDAIERRIAFPAFAHPECTYEIGDDVRFQVMPMTITPRHEAQGIQPSDDVFLSARRRIPAMRALQDSADAELLKEPAITKRLAGLCIGYFEDAGALEELIAFGRGTDRPDPRRTVEQFISTAYNRPLGHDAMRIGIFDDADKARNRAANLFVFLGVIIIDDALRQFECRWQDGFTLAQSSPRR